MGGLFFFFLGIGRVRHLVSCSIGQLCFWLLRRGGVSIYCCLFIPLLLLYYSFNNFFGGN